MKIVKFKFLLIVAASGSLFSCGQPSSKEILDSDIKAYIVSTNPCDAASACTKSFVEALKRKTENGTDSFCEELSKRSDGDLAICEVDIRNEKFEPLLTSCKDDLVERLQKISDKRNAGLKVHANVYSTEPIGLDIQLPTEIQTRDTSNGYLAVDGGVKKKQVVLTFDDGPEPINTLSIVRTLEEVGAKAHFFELGKNIQAHPELTRAVAEKGHSIGNHSWSHPNFRSISFADGLSQIKRTQAILYKVLGWAEPLFRFPYGNRTPELDQTLSQNHMADFYWAIDSNDWRMVNEDKTVRTNLQVVTDTINQLDRRGRGIILMHDIHRRTAELLPELLRLISERGYSTVLLQAADENLKNHPTLVN